MGFCRSAEQRNDKGYLWLRKKTCFCRRIVGSLLSTFLGIVSQNNRHVEPNFVPSDAPFLPLSCLSLSDLGLVLVPFVSSEAGEAGLNGTSKLDSDEVMVDDGTSKLGHAAQIV